MLGKSAPESAGLPPSFGTVGFPAGGHHILHNADSWIGGTHVLHTDGGLRCSLERHSHLVYVVRVVAVVGGIIDLCGKLQLLGSFGL